MYFGRCRLTLLALKLIKVNGVFTGLVKSYFCIEILTMKKLRWLTVLMVVTLVVIAGFQGYWLKNNYDREKRSLEIKAGVHFQETVRQLQAMKFKMRDPDTVDSSAQEKMRVFVSDDIPGEKKIQVNTFPRQEIITLVNTMRDKFKDSLNKNRKGNGTMIVSVDRNSIFKPRDSLSHNFNERIEINGGKTLRYLYGVDSLQDSLKVPEISTAYSNTLKEEKLDIPFKILRLDSLQDHEEPDLSVVTVGFAHPISYRVEMDNSFSYLAKKLTLPILFSVFLVGVTILCFVLLYRTLLKQQRLAAIKNEFISNITHELKTPIATVGVAIEALKNFNAMQDPERTREYLDISSNELQRLGLLVDKVLKLSMLEKKEIELKFEHLDLKTVVDEVTTSMRLQLEKSHATVMIRTEGDTTLQADRLHLLSVVFNLLDNSLKYSKEDPVILVELNGKENEVQLRITDNGIGISPEYKNRVFEKFFRVPAGNTHNAKGYGLGLSYVAHIIAEHNGTIQLESEEDKGTTFIIKLPKEYAGH